MDVSLLIYLICINRATYVYDVIHTGDDIIYITKPITTNPTHAPTTGQPTMYPTISPTNYPLSNPTQYPTKHPSIQPTAHPSHSPTISPTNHPSKQPTLKPTRSPTSSPTFHPTSSPTDSWDSATSARSNIKGRNKPKSKHRSNAIADESSDTKLLKDKRQKNVKIQNQIKKQKEQQTPKNSVKLYDFEIDSNFELSQLSMHGPVMALQDQLRQSDEHSLVILRVSSSKLLASNHTETATMETAFDATLDHFVYLVNVYKHHALNPNELDRNLLKLAVLMNLIFRCDSIEPVFDAIADEFRKDIANHRLNPYWKTVGEYILVDSLAMRNNTKFVKLAKYDFKIIPESLGVIYRFLLIAYEQILDGKLRCMEKLIYESRYSKDGKIPQKYKDQFKKLRSQYQHLMENVLYELFQTHQDLGFQLAGDEGEIALYTTGFILLTDYWHALSTFAQKLQIAQIIHEWRKKDKIPKNQGMIAVVAGPISNSTEINELLMVLGYGPGAISRYMVSSVPFPQKSKRDNQEAYLKITPISIDTQIKSKNNAKSNAKQDSDTKSSRRVKISSLQNTTCISSVNIEIKALNDPKSDLVIIMHHDLLHASRIVNNRYSLYHAIDFTFESIWLAVETFIEDILQPHFEEDDIKHLVIGLVLKCIYEYRMFEKSTFESLFKPMHKPRYTKFKLIAKAQYGKFCQHGTKFIDMTKEENRLFKLEHMTNEMIDASLTFVHIAMMHTSTAMKHNVENLMKLRYVKDHKLPKDFTETWISLCDQFKHWADTHWVALVKTFIFVRDREGAILCTTLPPNAFQYRVSWAGLKVFTEIGQILYEWGEKRVSGTAHIVINNNFISNSLYKILGSLGYANSSITVTEM